MPYDDADTFKPPSDDPLDLGDERPPLSRVAVAAMIIGVVFLIPWPPFVALMQNNIRAIGTGTIIGIIGAALAVILGILAFLLTRKNRRRGRWLGVTGCILGLLGIVLQFGVGYSLYNVVGSINHARKAVMILKTSSSKRAELAARWHQKFGSNRFQVSTTPQEFEEWLKQVADEHGQLQQIELNKSDSFDARNNVTTVKFKGHFVNGLMPVEVDVGFDDAKPKADNIRVGESSALE